MDHNDIENNRRPSLNHNSSLRNDEYTTKGHEESLFQNEENRRSGREERVNPKHLELLNSNSNRNTGLLDNADNVSTIGGRSSTIQVEWSPENEVIMVEWCDIAQCYKWLNARAHAKYSYMHAWYTIPAITLSTISGTASFAQASLPLSYQQFAPMVIGTINILIGILTTIQQYLKISELNEAHRVSSIAWDKFARNIRIELAKKPEERMEAGSFLKFNRQEFDRLMETSPRLKENVLREFTEKLSGKEGSNERKIFDALKKPDICNTIVSANETRHKWYLEIDKEIEHVDIIIDDEAIKSKDATIRAQQRKINDAVNELKRKEQDEAVRLRKQMDDFEKSKKHIYEEEQLYKHKTKCIVDYINSFENMYSRKPQNDEIRDNMKDDVDANILMQFLASYNMDR